MQKCAYDRILVFRYKCTLQFLQWQIGLLKQGGECDQVHYISKLSFPIKDLDGTAYGHVSGSICRITTF